MWIALIVIAVLLSLMLLTLRSVAAQLKTIAGLLTAASDLNLERLRDMQETQQLTYNVVKALHDDYAMINKDLLQHLRTKRPSLLNPD